MKTRTKYIFLSTLLLTLPLGFTSCGRTGNADHGEKDTTAVEKAYLPDTALYGKLGEGTGMSCVEIITREGDSLTLNKVNEHSGQAGSILGGTEYYGDSLTITTDAEQESILTLVNLSTLTRTWKAEAEQITIRLESGGKATAQWAAKDYNGWSMCNAHLVLESGGQADSPSLRDTFEISELNRDSLVLTAPDKTITFYSK